jgi:hypothetical protein
MLVLREALDMRMSDLRRSHGEASCISIGRICARGLGSRACTGCGREVGRGEFVIHGVYTTVAWCQTVAVRVFECSSCALEAVLSDATGVAARSGERF